MAAGGRGLSPWEACAMIRILFLITEFDRGGAERALHDIVRRIDRSRFAPQVAALGERGYYSERYRELGVPVHHLALGSARRVGALGTALAFPRGVVRLARILRRERIEVLQSFLFHANLAGRLAGTLAGTPVVLGGVRTAEPRHWHTLMDGLTFGLTDGEVCVSQAVRLFQASRAGLPAGGLPVIPNGIDPAAYPVAAAPFGLGGAQSLAARARARTDLGLPADSPVLCYVGRLSAAKALPDLLAAFASVAGAKRDALLVIAGDGPLAPMVRATVRRAGSGGRVRLTGWLDDPRPLYAAADCLVLSSRVEGMPGVVLEAMASGLPVVSTDAAGCCEVVVDGRTGFVVPRGDADALALRMLTVMDGPARAAEMGRRGRDRAFGPFHIERTVRSYEELYEALLKGKGRL